MKEIKITGTQEFFGKNIPVIEGGFSENSRIMTVQQIAVLHEMQSKHINELILKNEKEFEEGIDILNLLKVGNNGIEIEKAIGIKLGPATKNFFIGGKIHWLLKINLVYFKYLINIENISLSTANDWFPKESVIDAFLGVKGQRCPFQKLAFFLPWR